MKTIQEIAKEWSGVFKKEPDGKYTIYYESIDNYPKAELRSIARDHKEDVDIVHTVLCAIADSMEDSEIEDIQSDIEGDVYYSDMIDWLAQAPAYRMNMVDELVGDIGYLGLFDMIREAQAQNKRSIAQALWDLINEELALAEEDEE